MDDPKTLRRHRANLQGEVDGAAVYAALAKAEADPKLAEIYRRLAAVGIGLAAAGITYGAGALVGGAIG